MFSIIGDPLGFMLPGAYYFTRGSTKPRKLIKGELHSRKARTKWSFHVVDKDDFLQLFRGHGLALVPKLVPVSLNTLSGLCDTLSMYRAQLDAANRRVIEGHEAETEQLATELWDTVNSLASSDSAGGTKQVPLWAVSLLRKSLSHIAALHQKHGYKVLAPRQAEVATDTIRLIVDLLARPPRY
jgi:hypothetical protein